MKTSATKPEVRSRTGSERERVMADLEALIIALDRRVPRIERAGELKIATDASVLKEKALARLHELRLIQA